MKINMAENEYFPVGMVLSCTTCHGQKLQGEVMAFDYQTKMLALKSVSSVKGGGHDVRLVNMQYVGDLKVIKEATESPPPLSNLNLSKIAGRFCRSVEEKLKQVHYMGVGVTPNAQRLVNHITKTISDVRWDGQNIIVMDTVRITAPYQSENVNLIKEKEKEGRAQQTLQHVRKLVEKHLRDEARESSVSRTSSYHGDELRESSVSSNASS